ncbi:MAG: metal-dependent transcriptional regulator [Promethearchaeota archaeon]|nr:MAG: metal-dependent transcriptional regulator [Candidatus Lokiarchaeota archaeon]
MLDIDYRVLRKLFQLGELKVGTLAKKLGIPHSTVGSCIKRLEEKELVIYDRYKPVFLSDKGIELAVELIRHARLLEMLLINELDMSPEIAHTECEKFNLLFSCDLINKICQRYNHPRECPCGEEILSTSDCSCDKNF